MSTWVLKVKTMFTANHSLDNEPFHTHNYRVEAEFLVHSLKNRSHTFDFHKIESFIKGFLPDRKNLNKVFSFPTSTENIARWIYKRLNEKYPVFRVTVWESESFGASYGDK